MRVVIAAAGTGGHLFPALAVADALVDEGAERSDIIFFGGDRLETDLVPAAGYELISFELAKLRRSLSVDNLRIPLVVRRATIAMRRTLEERAVDVVLGASGYVTVPAARAARRARLPFYLQEQNAEPGLAARYAARSARAVFLGFPGRAERLPNAVVTGNPLRSVFASFDRTRLRPEARRRYHLPANGLTMGVLGGSQGAQVLNEVVRDVARQAPAGVSIVHLTGRAAHDKAASIAASASLPWRCVPFEDRMEMFYAACDVVLARAGAMTVSELTSTGTPAVFVPLSSVGQRANTDESVAAGGALVVAQSEASRLPDVLGELLTHPGRLTVMADRMRELGHPEAAAVVARRLLEHR